MPEKNNSAHIFIHINRNYGTNTKFFHKERFISC